MRSFADRRSTEVAADPAAVWDALVEEIGDGPGSGPLGAVVMRMLRVRDRAADGRFPAEGSTVRALRVVASDPPRRLVLDAENRYAGVEYEIEIAPRASGGSEMSFATRSEFKGRRGSLYGAYIVRFGFHRASVRSVLRKVRKRAERA
jgi:hypothetical protein